MKKTTSLVRATILFALFSTTIPAIQAQSIERFRFAAASDWQAIKNFDIDNPIVNPGVSSTGFRHAAGATVSRGRTYLLGAGVTSPEEVPPPRQLTPVRGGTRNYRRAKSLFDTSASERQEQRAELTSRLEKFQPVEGKAKKRSYRSKSTKSGGPLKRLFGRKK